MVLMRRRYPSSSGFTLFELLLVVAIMSIFAGILMVGNMTAQVKKGRDSKRRQELYALRRTLEDYYNDKGAYPISLASSRDGLDCFNNPNGLKPYIERTPCDPGYPTNTYFYINDDSIGQTYRIYANFEYHSDPEFLKNPCASGCNVGSHTFNFEMASTGIDLVSNKTPPGGVYTGPP